MSQTTDIVDETQSSPAKSVQIDRALVELPTDNDPQEDYGFKLGALKRDGTYFVYADSADLNVLHNPIVKRKAWDFRFRLGMSNAGIEAYGGPAPISPKDPMPCLVEVPEGKPAFRQEFKLTAGF